MTIDIGENIYILCMHVEIYKIKKTLVIIK